jgi:hypothetical protein
MNALAPYMAALRQEELLDEAESERRARLAAGSQPSVPAWRRGIGGVLAAAARSIDPGVDARRSNGRSDQGARALAV